MLRRQGRSCALLVRRVAVLHPSTEEEGRHSNHDCGHEEGSRGAMDWKKATSSSGWGCACEVTSFNLACKGVHVDDVVVLLLLQLVGPQLDVIGDAH